MEAFCVDGRVDEELVGLMEDLGREFYGEECSVHSQFSENEFENGGKHDESAGESECEEEDEVDSQLIARNYVDNCAESDEECCEVGSRAQVQGIFRDGCGCEKGCFEKLNFEVTFVYRLQLAEFSREEKDILLLTKLENMEVRSENVRTRKRSRQRYRYEFQGQLICENAWRCIHDIGK